MMDGLFNGISIFVGGFKAEINQFANNYVASKIF